MRQKDPEVERKKIAEMYRDLCIALNRGAKKKITV